MGGVVRQGVCGAALSEHHAELRRGVRGLQLCARGAALLARRQVEQPVRRRLRDVDGAGQDKKEVRHRGRACRRLRCARAMGRRGRRQQAVRRRRVARLRGRLRLRLPERHRAHHRLRRDHGGDISQAVVRSHAHRRRSGQSVHLAAVRAVCPRSYWCASQAWRAGAARCALSRVRGGRRRVSVGRNECVVGASCVMLDEVVMCSEFRRESVLLSLGVKPCF
mmetsp:Transcript_12787/g.30262  ORF Transcript_12787/g.30262 Transcript_12787/m.30262 type:complete len:222 (+) Transcript_12787:388-1053(+)